MKTSLCLVVVLVYTCQSVAGRSAFDWFGKDSFDFVMSKYSSVSKSNCFKKSAQDLQLPASSVSQLPRSNLLLDVETRIFRNRTCLLAMHDLALSRSYYLSMIFKMTNRTVNFYKQPDWEYFYFRQTGFVNSFPCINSSAVFFDFNKTYPNWLHPVPLNVTIDFFAPKVFRYDDTRSAFMREPTLNSVRAWDIGAGKNRNYTNKAKGFNPWYSVWLPDKLVDKSLKGSYSIGIKRSTVPGKWTSKVFEGHTFFGPPLTKLQDDINVPTKYTVPYFDCGSRNQWLVSSVAPVVDILPRYRREREIKEFGESIPTFVAAATMSTDFNKIDINPCPEGEGNPGPNIFAGIARCKETTMCQPLTGWGFARGSYECVCRPGYRLPAWQDGPFQGADIELATEDEYKNGFDCLKIGYMKVVPSVIERNATNTSLINNRKKREASTLETSIESTIQRRHVSPAQAVSSIRVKSRRSVTARNKRDFEKILIEKRKREVYGFSHSSSEIEDKSQVDDVTDLPKSRTKREFRDHVTDESAVKRMEQIFEHIAYVSQASDCRKLPAEQLILPGDVGYRAKEQFQYQGRTAVAMAHFLSAIYQNVVARRQSFATLKGGSLLNTDQLHAEVISTVMSDHKIRGFGIWFDYDQFEEPSGDEMTATRRQLFAPYAFQQNGEYKSVDMAGDPNVGSYLKTDWFRKTKMRWMNTGSGITKHKLKPKVRSNVKGYSEEEFYYDAYFYRGPKYEAGYWSSPYYACTDYINDWVMTYAIPFFKMHPFNYDVPKFMGVVTVDIKLNYLDINQCSQPFWVPNAFKDTALCDYETTRCEPIEGKRLSKGAYRCHCKQGYEYPFIENAWFFDGSFMESEHEKKQLGKFSRYEHMKCRTGGSPQIRGSLLSTIQVIVVGLLCRSAF